MAGAGAEVNSDGRGGGGKEWRGGELGARYPAPLAACMRRLAGSSEADIMARYGLTNPLPASVLRNRSRGEWVGLFCLLSSCFFLLLL